MSIDNNLTAEKLRTLTASNGAFSSQTPGLQLVWDNHSLSLLKSCPRKYYLSMIEGFTPVGMAIDLAFGIVYHESLELYERERHSGTGHEGALLEAVHYALTQSGTRERHYHCEGCGSEGPARDAVEECPQCQSHVDALTFKSVFVPWDSPKKAKTRETLIRTIVWYLEEHKEEENIKTHTLANGDPALEVHFKIPVEFFSGSGEQFSVAGYLDRIIEWGGDVHIQDRKTTASSITPEYFKRYSPDGQMSMYSLAAKALGIITTQNVSIMIEAAQTTVNFSEFLRGLTTRTPGQLSEFFAELKFWIAQAEAYAQAQFWPMNETACFMCAFREVCAKDPAMRQQFLESSFQRRAWDPSTTRQEVTVSA